MTNYTAEDAKRDELLAAYYMPVQASEFDARGYLDAGTRNLLVRAEAIRNNFDRFEAVPHRPTCFGPL